MAFEDLKERLKEQAQAVWAKVQESPPYQEVSEKFLDLNPNAQKAVLFGGGALVALILVYIPYGLFYSASQNTVMAFEDKKTMMRELYRVSRRANALPPIPQSLNPNELRNSVQGVISQQQPPLLPEQQGAILDFDNSSQPTGISKALTQKGVIVNLNQLNLDQVVKIGGALQGLRSTVKMTGFRVAARSDDPHYFDVQYKLVGFNLPPEPVAKGAAARPGARPSAK